LLDFYCSLGDALSITLNLIAAAESASGPRRTPVSNTFHSGTACLHPAIAEQIWGIGPRAVPRIHEVLPLQLFQRSAQGVAAHLQALAQGALAR
jgi:hypothetical protein